MAHWLFQGNPKYYRIKDAIRDFEEMPWLVTRYIKEIAIGDEVAIWVAGKEAGIYALAEVTDPPKMWESVPDLSYWLDKSRLGTKHQAQIRFTRKLLNEPILRQDAMKDPILNNLLVIRAPSATNFKVTPEQWQRIQQLTTQS